ncbi:23S rRNA (guanosine(2251)-2'-O)-methyltransferase RlmB [Sulfobacillus harzensis]|uniref:23S rRNA (Guanosine(2251)-2'-O)-methyltransferase RlmB n=1 Tax=Sulfobacillus harzensis TaxID=2729629 RepID=A0A7Y0Q269_9FIRM|nr:23S rRNA (guanosine(2251)-2'-O)-methyltransferase RlmB [Sulfobacillus harzensis]NMP22172.1 23S rRNA (guanosine(2251)-2'-O)-methyltransferase RlmB [Sulfobacillus harzensis]
MGRERRDNHKRRKNPSGSNSYNRRRDEDRRAMPRLADDRQPLEDLEDTPVLVGRHPVLEALRAERAITRLWLQEGLKEGSLREIVSLCRERHVPVTEVPKAFLDRLGGELPHQGVAAQVALKPTLSLDDLPEIIQALPTPMLYILDGIQDPHNVGAILRTADATGAAAVVIPERGAAGLTAVVAKASAGAMEYVPVVRVTNLSQAIDKIKQMGVFVYAADPEATALYTEVDWTGPVAVIIGAEGRGIRPLVKRRADGLIKLPMLGHVSSLNASNAAAVIGFEAVRQRLRKKSLLTRI